MERKSSLRNMKGFDNAFRATITYCCYYCLLYWHERDRNLKPISWTYREGWKPFLDISVNNVIHLACLFLLYCLGRLLLGCFLFLFKFSRDLHDRLTISKDFLCLETVMFVYIGFFLISQEFTDILDSS